MSKNGWIGPNLLKKDKKLGNLRKLGSLKVYLCLNWLSTAKMKFCLTGVLEENVELEISRLDHLWGEIKEVEKLHILLTLG